MELREAAKGYPDPADGTPGQRAHGASIALHAALALFLAAAAVFFYSRELGLAGLNIDDAQTAMWTFAVWRGFPLYDFDPKIVLPHVGRLSLSLASFSYSPFLVGNHWLPVAYGAYTGPWAVYTFAPFLVIADRTLAIRSYILAWSAAAAAVVYLSGFIIAEDLGLAVLTGLAAATWPYMCETVVWGFSGSGVIPVSLGLAGLALLAYASKRRSLDAWYASCAAVGLGTGFFVQCAAFSVAWALGAFWLRDRLKTAWAGGRHVAAKSAGWLLLANLPLLEVNLFWRWPRWITLHFILDHLTLSANEVRNADYGPHLLMRLDQAWAIFGHSRVWLALLALTAVVQALALASGGRGRTFEKEALLPSLYCVVMLVLSPLTLSSLGAYHIVALFPLALLSLAGLPRLLPARQRAATLACAAALGAGLAANAADLRGFWARASAGKAELVNPRLERLADWLVRENPPEVVSITPNIPDTVLSWLTRDRIRAREWMAVPVKSFPPDGPAELRAALRAGSPAYFVSDPGTDALFRQLCALNRRIPKLLRDFPDTATPGRISVYRLEGRP